MQVNTVPAPLPGHVQPAPIPLPAPNPIPAWAGKDLVRISSDLVKTTGTERMDASYRGITGHGTHGQAAFQRLGSGSFRDAVEAASALAATHTLELNFHGINPAERSASSAIALLQATDGTYYATGLETRGFMSSAYATVDTGKSNFIVHDVEQLHPDVRAVVGAYSWVNFTGDDITPTMAG